MSRTPIIKELVNTRLASGHGGWVYCDSCGENIGYLCYVTYDDFRFSYTCKCGSHGSMHLSFKTDESTHTNDDHLITIKNRLCCPQDHSPLFTILHKKLENSQYQVTCTKCGETYASENTQ